MNALEVWKNGNKVLTAGKDDVFFLLGVLRWIRDEDGERADLVCSGNSHTDDWEWNSIPLKQGDELLIRLVDVGDADVTRPDKQIKLSDFPMDDGS